jgi:hypothetical protein
MKLLAKIIGSLVAIYCASDITAIFCLPQLGFAARRAQNKRYKAALDLVRKDYPDSLYKINQKLAQAQRHRLVGRICRRCSI